LYGEQLGMSKRKKIFHKPEENVPSADDILNYLNEETPSMSSTSISSKSSPMGGAFEANKKEEASLEINSFDDFQKKKEDAESDVTLPGLPSEEKLSAKRKAKSSNVISVKNNKKKISIRK